MTTINCEGSWVFCKKCGYENDDDALYCEKCGASLSSTNSSKFSSLGKTNKILIVAVVLFILVIVVIAGMIMINKAQVTNNTSNVTNNINTTANVSETVTTTPKSENATTTTSKKNNFDLTCYTLTDVRSLGYCKLARIVDMKQL